MPGSVIVGSARTPIGKLSGALAGFSATDLGGLAIKAALERAGVGAEQVDYVLMGQVLQAGQGQITARQAAVEGRHPDDRSRDDGQQGVPLGHQRDLPRRPDDPARRRRSRRRGRHGVDDATRRTCLPGARAGYRMGNNEVVDSLINDGLWCAFDAVHMGAGTENYVGQVGGITREAQDEARGQERTSAPPPRRRKAASPTRSRRSRSRSARATRSSSTPTKACGPAPPPSRSAACAPRSRRTARSPPATRRRSPTAAPRSS